MWEGWVYIKYRKRKVWVYITKLTFVIEFQVLLYLWQKLKQTYKQHHSCLPHLNQIRCTIHPFIHSQQSQIFVTLITKRKKVFRIFNFHDSTTIDSFDIIKFESFIIGKGSAGRKRIDVILIASMKTNQTPSTNQSAFKLMFYMYFNFTYMYLIIS